MGRLCTTIDTEQPPQVHEVLSTLPSTTTILSVRSLDSHSADCRSPMRVRFYFVRMTLSCHRRTYSVRTVQSSIEFEKRDFNNARSQLRDRLSEGLQIDLFRRRGAQMYNSGAETDRPAPARRRRATKAAVVQNIGGRGPDGRNKRVQASLEPPARRRRQSSLLPDGRNDYMDARVLTIHSAT